MWRSCLDWTGTDVPNMGAINHKGTHHPTYTRGYLRGIESANLYVSEAFLISME